MNVRRLRLLAPLALAIALIALPAPAGATTKFDSSYQNGGMLLLPAIKGVYGQNTRTCVVAGKRLYIAGAFGSLNVNGGTALATTSVSIQPRQPMTLGVANVRWKKQRVPSKSSIQSSDYDTSGGFAYVTSPDRQPKTGADRVTIFRIAKTGNRVKSFGRNGYVTVSLPRTSSKDSPYTRVIALPKGKVFLLTQSKAGLVVRKFTSRGKLDSTWGSEGVATLATPAAFEGTPLGPLDAASETSDGGLLVPASGTPTAPQPNVLGLIKLTGAGEIDSSWANAGLWTPPLPAAPPTYDINGRTLLTAEEPGGTYAIVYADAMNEDLGIDSSLKLIRVDAKTGKLNSAVHGVGDYYNGGDDGFPDADPWALTATQRGAVFAFAASFYTRVGGSFRGAITEISAKPKSPIIRRDVNNSGFATGAFAADPAQPFVYLCGSYGLTSSRMRDDVKRDQRKNVAIRRVKL